MLRFWAIQTKLTVDPILVRYNLLQSTISKLKIKKEHNLSNISASSNRKRMQHDLLEPSHRAESNGGSYTLLRPLDAEIFNETVNGAVT